MADCDAVTVVGNLLKQRVVLRGDTCTFLYLDGKSLVLDTYQYTIPIRNSNMRCIYLGIKVRLAAPTCNKAVPRL